MKLHTLRYSNPLSAILEDFLSIRFKPHQVVHSILFREEQLLLSSFSRHLNVLNALYHCMYVFEGAMGSLQMISPAFSKTVAVVK